MEQLREACAEVARRARSVRIADAAIGLYAASLPGTPPLTGEADDDDFAARATRSERALYWLTLDAINFGSGWFPTLRKPNGRSGYGTISAAWRARWQADGPLDAAGLTALSPADVAAVLGQDPGHELMELYALSLGDLGARLIDGFDGDPLGLLDAAGGSALALVSELGGWPCFDDLRRAGVVTWRDEDRLTLFADNLVPHVLRLDGVLHFDPDLVARIDAGELIEHGSPEEVEIRACAVEAVERIVTTRSDRASAAQIDQVLWQRGQGARYKAHPRHRSRCTAY